MSAPALANGGPDSADPAHEVRSHSAVGLIAWTRSPRVLRRAIRRSVPTQSALPGGAGASEAPFGVPARASPPGGADQPSESRGRGDQLRADRRSIARARSRPRNL